MGYKRTQTYYDLDFDDEFGELEVRMRRGSIRERMDFEAIADWQERVTRLADFVVSWNVEYDEKDQKAGVGNAGEVMEISADSMWSLEEPTLVAILHAWQGAVTVPLPLEAPSIDGVNESEAMPATNPEQDLDLEASIRMESLAS